MNGMKTPKEVYKELKANRAAAKIAKALEVEKASVRTPITLQTEYARLSGIAGDKQFRIKVLEAELNAANEEMYKLSQEFGKSEKVHGPLIPPQNKPQETAPAPVQKNDEQNGGFSEAAH